MGPESTERGESKVAVGIYGCSLISNRNHFYCVVSLSLNAGTVVYIVFAY